jgi:hypothetical protein
MDINCPVCGEPWDIDSLHDELTERYDGDPPRGDAYQKEFSELQAEFYRKGCVAFSDVVQCERPEGGSMKAMASSALYDILGDDIDGIASMLEDMGDEW